MKKKWNYKSYGLVVIGLTLLINSCKKDTDPISNELDKITEAELSKIDAAGIDTVSNFEDALFPDGSNVSEWAKLYDSDYHSFNKKLSLLSASEKKKLFIERMYKSGFYLTNDNQFSFPLQPNGLAYVLGSKYIDSPSKYSGNSCQEPLYGLDCSGMIYQMAKSSNLNLIPSGTIDYVKVSIWNNAFNNSPDFNGLEMTDLFALPVSEIQAGDILVASGKHIGWVFDDGINVSIFNSLGSGAYSCEVNSASNHGPVITKNIPSWWISIVGSNYHVLRVKSTTQIIKNTIWDVTIYFNNSNSWHANVTFNTGGITKYDEPSNPGAYLTYGKWITNNDQIHWSIGLDPDYIFDGVIIGDKMSGTFVYNGETKTWSANKIK